MTDIFLLSIRNILRSRRRVILPVLSIIVGFTALACLGGFINYSFEGLREGTIRSQIGHMQIFAEGYGEKHLTAPDEVMIKNPAPLIAGITALDGVELVTPRLSFSGLGSTGSASVNMRVTGVDPAKERAFAGFEVVVEGRRLRATDTDGGVVGEQLFRGLGAAIGDRVTVITNSADGALNAIDFRIIGVMRTGSAEYDSVFVKIPIGLARQARGIEGVESLIVLLHDTDALAAARPQIESVLDANGFAYEIREWTELAGFYNAVVRLYRGFFGVFAGAIALVVMFAVAGAMIMAVFDRRDEIGILRAMGMSRARLAGMFLLEGIWIGLIGAGLGAALSWAVANGVALAGGIPVPPPPGATGGFRAHLTITPQIYGIAFLVVFAATLLPSLWPATAAARVRNLTRFSLRLFRNRHEWRNLLAEILQSHDITVEQWLLLASLDEAEGGLSMTELSAGQGMNMPGVTKNVDKLIAGNLVRREKGDEGNRRVLIHLTDKGRGFLADSARDLRAVNRPPSPGKPAAPRWREIVEHLERS